MWRRSSLSWFLSACSHERRALDGQSFLFVSHPQRLHERRHLPPSVAFARAGGYMLARARRARGLRAAPKRMLMEKAAPRLTVGSRTASSWSFEVSSELAADAATVWAHAVSARGVNRELAPLARMTLPRDGSLFAPDVVLGERLFRSWILLGRFLPVDYDDVTIVELEPGRRFLERSPMLSQRLWEHERIVEPSGAGCRVVDRIEHEPKIGLLGPVYAAVFKASFRLRHRNLRRLFSRRWVAA